SPQCHSTAAPSEREGDDVDLRQMKGLEIAARAVVRFQEGAWIVPSQSGSGSYRVVLAPEGGRCECEDFQLTQGTCKHIHAARIVWERTKGGRDVAFEIVKEEDVPKKPTYRQDWPRYNEAQQTEKHRFLALLFDLCQGVDEPPPA